MSLNKDQLEIIAKYFADFSKILVGSVVVGFFLPTATPIPLGTFAVGLGIAIASLLLSVRFLK